MLTNFPSDSVWKCIHLTCWVRENDKAAVKRLYQRQLSSNYIPAEHCCEFQSCHVVYLCKKVILPVILEKLNQSKESKDKRIQIDEENISHTVSHGFILSQSQLLTVALKKKKNYLANKQFPRLNASYLPGST